MPLLRKRRGAADKSKHAEPEVQEVQQIMAEKSHPSPLISQYKEPEHLSNDHDAKENNSTSVIKVAKQPSPKKSSPDMYSRTVQWCEASPYGVESFSASHVFIPMAYKRMKPDGYQNPGLEHWSPHMPNGLYHCQSPFAASSTCFAPYSMSTSALLSPVGERSPPYSPETPQSQATFDDPAAYDYIATRMSAILDSVDGHEYSLPNSLDTTPFLGNTGLGLSKTSPVNSKFKVKEPKEAFKASKAWLYANSRLPSNLPRLQVYTPTHPILCLAARHCYLSYSSPRPQPTDEIYHQQPVLVPASVRQGTKAMLLSVIPVDDKQNIVLAIRGTAGIFDWIANFDVAPESPAGFLDDEGNLVHAGFLAAARAMIVPLTRKLRLSLAESPARQRFSLIITGHSAGGAVASLLFCHMLSQSSSVASELKDLARHFKRIHCITFGAPPLSLLPLGRPDDRAGRWRKNLFFSFVNEGDPIARITPGAAKNLLRLHALPAPVAVASSSGKKRRPAWKVPAINFCNAGRVIVLRREPVVRPPPVVAAAAPPKKTPSPGLFASLKTGAARPLSVLSAIEAASTTNVHKVEAVEVTDEQLRRVVFADPKMHPIGLYEARIRALAVKAVTAGLYNV